MAPTLAFGHEGVIGEGPEIGGLGGYAAVNPANLNNYISLQSTTPKLSDVYNGIFYGGFVRFWLPLRLGLEFRYESLEAKNIIATSGSPNNGLDLIQNGAWQIIDFLIVKSDVMGIYIGAGVGYPLYNHVSIQVNNTKTDYDADKTISALGKVGLEFGIGKSLAVSFEGAYVISNSYSLSSPSGTVLQINGSNAQMSLSGIRATQSLIFRF